MIKKVWVVRVNRTYQNKYTGSSTYVCDEIKIKFDQKISKKIEDEIKIWAIYWFKKFNIRACNRDDKTIILSNVKYSAGCGYSVWDWPINVDKEALFKKFNNGQIIESFIFTKNDVKNGVLNNYEW